MMEPEVTAAVENLAAEHNPSLQSEFMYLPWTDLVFVYREAADKGSINGKVGLTRTKKVRILLANPPVPKCVYLTCLL